ncbi:MAG: hypothetical protein IKV35_07080 [Clostridia bacterium]|nr:hypothetical protein [Clostridia bacterium]
MNAPTVYPEKIPAVYEWKTRIRTVDVGPDRLLTPTAQLQYQQEAGERHFGEGNLGFETIAQFGMAFLLLQNNAVIYRRPTANEDVVIKTWSHSVKGVKFFRAYRFEDTDGNTLIDSTATFVLVDVNAHTMLRPSQFPVEIAHHGDLPHSCPLPEKLKMPAETEACGEHRVMLSQLDFNGHLNNTRYADIVFDHLPVDAAQTMTGFSIAFVHEAKWNDTLRLSYARTENGYMMTAENGDDTCFTAQVRK